jgi:hypothetical protein
MSNSVSHKISNFWRGSHGLTIQTSFLVVAPGQRSPPFPQLAWVYSNADPRDKPRREEAAEPRPTSDGARHHQSAWGSAFAGSRIRADR